MNDDRQAPAVRAFLVLGHLLFLGLFILAYIHALPRTVHVDSAFQIFKWIHIPGVGVEAHRFSAVIPQLLVKLVMFTGAPLQTLLLVASLAHVLVPYALFVIIAHVLRIPWIAMALVLAQVLCTRLTFYGIVLEANYLLSYPFLLAALLEGPLRSSAHPSVLAALVIATLLVLVVHPVGCIIALFVLLYHLVRSGAGKWVVRSLLILCLLWPFLGRLLFPPTPYEAGLYTSTGEGIGVALGFFGLPGWRFLVEHTWIHTTHYVSFWCALLTLIILQVRRRAFLELGLVLASVSVYIVLNVITYHQGETAMMMEKNFVPLATLVALPLLAELWRQSGRARWFAVASFSLVLFVQFRSISFASKPARERMARIQAVVDDCREEGVQKACSRSATLDAQGLHIHWALAFETLLLSSVDGPERSVSVVAGDHCPPKTFDADFSGLIPTRTICGNGSTYFRLPFGPYAVLSAHE